MVAHTPDTKQGFPQKSRGGKAAISLNDVRLWNQHATRESDGTASRFPQPPQFTRELLPLLRVNLM